MAWRSPPGLTRAERAAEQDKAAGGRKNRMVIVSGQAILCSVALRRKRDGRRVYAYLRWSNHGRTAERYLGEVDEATRSENLARAWSLATASDVTSEPAGDERSGDRVTSRGGGSWASSPAVRAVMQGNKGRDTRP